MKRALLSLRALVFPAVIGVIVFAAAGRWDLPMTWGVLGILAFFVWALAFSADPNLIRERLRPGPGNQDHLTRPASGVFIVTHWIVAGLDVGRYQWSVVPWGIQLAGVIGYGLMLVIVFWATRENTFYSSVVRVQHDRGHRPITTGPYRFVRHPGYAATMAAMLAGGAAFGSWLGMLPIVALMPVWIRRTLLEDRMLQQELDGYADYARRVRYRLLVGVF